MHMAAGSELVFQVDCFFTLLLWENVLIPASGNGSQIFKALYYLGKSLVRVLPSVLHLPQPL